MSTIIAPSILSADFANLANDIKMLNSSNAGLIHCDVMDGVFVPNISFGIPIIGAVKKVAQKPLDVHLMIVDPDKYIYPFRDAGASILTVHYEACTHLHRTVTEIRKSGMEVGVALNPHTPVVVLKDILPFIDMVLIMSVNPGFGGQSFIENSYSKISELHNMITDKGYSVSIEVDGGVNLSNAPKLIAAGADILVAGNTVFNSNNPIETISQLGIK